MAEGAIDSARFRTVMGHFATGVTVVTAVHEGTPVGFTAQSFVSLSLEPPLVAVCPGVGSSSWPRIAAAAGLCINMLAADQETLCRAFATAGADKFAGVGWSPSPISGAPVLDGCLAWVDCAIEATHEGGDHLVVVARVLELGGAEGGDPLLFYRGGFGRFTA